MLFVVAFSAMSCSDYLERESDSIYTDDEIFSDELMIKSVLANLYGRINYEPDISSPVDYGKLDEACYGGNGGDPNHDVTYSQNQWRVYDYGLIRNMNQFLQGVRNTSVLDDSEKMRYEAEVRFLRAWVYFCMARGLGGMPIVGDQVFDYDPNEDVVNLQIPRSTEAEIYDYIISECDFAAKYLPSVASENINSSRAISWVALSLKARAALYAGSLAKYNNLVTPNIKTDGGEVGIAASEAERFYRIAYNAADTIIKSKQYQLYDKEADKADNFYKATSSKQDNPEIIWARDFSAPEHSHNWSERNGPTILTKTSSGNNTTPLLNLVEAFEYLDNRDGHLKLEDSKGNPIFYDDPADVFANKDPRLRGTVMLNGDSFAGTKIEYQAGQYYYQGRWKIKKGTTGSVDNQGNVVTATNGPQESSNWGSNKTGFNFRKFTDESSSAFDPTYGSEIEFIRFRYAEILMIASEAALELGDKPTALNYINMIRQRAGLGDLTDMTLLDIEQERRVEFALENHRWWDLKRWRRAHIVWDGTSEDSRHYGLFPYKVVDRRRPENGKWVYVRTASPIMLEARTFQLRNYYNAIDPSWMSNNPKLVKNPYQ